MNSEIRNPQSAIDGNSKLVYVLIVDDDELVLKALARSLRKEEFNIMTAPSGSEALKHLHGQDVALIISDYKMPGMNGIELLEKVKEIYPLTIRILLTGHADLKVAEEAVNRGGIYQFLTKPWEDRELKNVVRSALRQFELENENQNLLQLLHEKYLELDLLNRQLEARVDERTSELKESQARLYQSEKMAELGFFASGIAHELNNPLCTILANTQLLLLRGKGKEGESELREIENACLRERDIIRDLQTFARPNDLGRNDSSIEPGSEIKKIYPLIRAAAKARGMEIRVKEGEETGLRARGNPQKVSLILMSLISNAVQAGSEGGWVEIGAGISKEQRMVEIFVRDNGSGISPEDLAHVFDPFFSTREPGEGTGMGLAISHELARSMGGRLEVESELNRGSCFRLLLKEDADE